MSRARAGGSRLLLLGAVLLAVVVAAVIVIDGRDDGSGSAADVVVVGDSLTVESNGSLPTDGWTVDAQYGRRTSEGAAILRDLDLPPGATVVVALGTNDVPEPADQYAARIDEVVAAIGPGHPILWVNVDANTPALAAAADGVNAAIREAGDRHPRFEVADWDRHVTTVEGFDAMRNADGVHYLPAGSQERARWLASLVGD